MKKVIAIFAIAALTACGSNNTAVVNVADSTAVQTDSAQVDSAKVDGVVAEPTPVVGDDASKTLGNPTKQLDK